MTRQMPALPFPLLWPRRTGGSCLRVIALVGADLRAEASAALAVLLSLPADRFDVTLAVAGGTMLPLPPLVTEHGGQSPRALPIASNAGVNDAKRIAALDPDVLVDLAGAAADTAVLLACRPARVMVAIEGISTAVDSLPDRSNVAVTALAGVLDDLQRANAATDNMPDAAAMMALWEKAVRAHQRGDVDAARAGYQRVLAMQPGYAPAHYLFGNLLRDSGDPNGARVQFERAVAAAPYFTDAWKAAANAALVDGDGAAASLAFERVLSHGSGDALTHYNHGVALQIERRAEDALRAYERALALDPGFVSARFNLGTLHQELGHADAAIDAYERVLRAEPANAAAFKYLGEVLFGAGRIDAWLANFRRFEAACPETLPLVVQALEACQYGGDFTRLDHYLHRIEGDRFVVHDDVELVDCLEQLLFLLLYFDVAPETLLRLAQTYDAAARRVYGEPFPPLQERRPGRLRIGYLSADLRNHVMGKMMWQALQHHDRQHFALYFYSLSTVEDDWTQRYRALGDGFEVLAALSERAAAERIAEDDLDILVDLSTHTKGARPGILAFKPARLQLTHVASAGTVGLSTIDYKLTDHQADLPANEARQLEKLLPIDGCIYPYRHVTPAGCHDLSRTALGIGANAVVLGAFVTGLKLSRRCLALWREVLERVPRGVLAFSPVTEQQRASYLRIASAGGIAKDRIVFVPQGHDDAENQARYSLVDFALDPMPYGGVNGTLEALDAGVPVVTLLGQRHGERTSYSILANLGVTQTVAYTGREYVHIAARLADDVAFMRDVRAAIRAGLERSTLVDQVAHTRSLERAYLWALEQECPAALAAARHG